MHIKVYMKRKESVSVGCRHVNSRIARFWKTNATPIRELNRLKFEDIVGMLKFGRST